MTTQTPATPKTPGNSRRKSVSQSAKKNKKQVVQRQDEGDIINEVFNIFDEKIKKTKQVNK